MFGMFSKIWFNKIIDECAIKHWDYWERTSDKIKVGTHSKAHETLPTFRPRVQFPSPAPLFSSSIVSKSKTLEELSKKLSNVGIN